MKKSMPTSRDQNRPKTRGAPMPKLAKAGAGKSRPGVKGLKGEIAREFQAAARKR